MRPRVLPCDFWHFGHFGPNLHETFRPEGLSAGCLGRVGYQDREAGNLGEVEAGRGPLLVRTLAIVVLYGSYYWPQGAMLGQGHLKP